MNHLYYGDNLDVLKHHIKDETVESGGPVSVVMQSFRHFLGTNDLLAYLTMMAPRLAELHRILRPTGSLYLNCDPNSKPLPEGTP